MKSPVAVAASQPAPRPTGTPSMTWGVSNRSLMLLWGVLFVAELLHIPLWSDTTAPVTGTEAGGGSTAHGPSLSGLCTSTPCCKRRSHTSPQSRGQVWAVLKPGRQFCSPSCPPWQWDSENTALALLHLSSCTQPDWCSCTRAPSQDTAQPQWSLALQRGDICIWGWASPDSVFPGPKRAFLGSMCIQDPPWVPFHCPTSFGLHSTRPAHGSSHGLGTTAYTPLNPAHCRLVRCPPKQLLQPHLLLSAHGKDTPGTGKTLMGPGAWGMLLSRGISAQQGEAAMSLLGSDYQQPTGKSPVPHTNLFLISPSSPHYCGS